MRAYNGTNKPVDSKSGKRRGILFKPLWRFNDVELHSPTVGRLIRKFCNALLTTKVSQILKSIGAMGVVSEWANVMVVVLVKTSTSRMIIS